MFLFVDAGILGSARLGCNGFGDTLLGDALRGGAFSCSGASKGSKEAIYIYLRFASLRLQGGVHRGEQLRPKLVKYLVDVDIRQ
jgi:hypothetical protein